MSISMENALFKYTKDEAPDTAVGSGGMVKKEVAVLMTPTLLDRRKTMLILHYSGKLNPDTIQILADRFNTSPGTLQRDWERRENWEYLIWEIYEANDDGKKRLAQLQIAKETACDIMRNPRIGANARVGAIARYIECIRTEIELLQSLGMLPKQINPAVPISTNAVEYSAALMIKGVFWERPMSEPPDMMPKDDDTEKKE